MDKQSESMLHRMLVIRTIIIGIFGGLFWALFYLIMYAFKMTEVDPKILLEIVFQDGKWITRWYGNIIFILLSSLVSTIIAFIYFFLFKKQTNWAVGAIYGIFVWLIVYLLFPILLNDYNPFIQHEVESNVAIFCLFILYGVFVGYSISFDYENLKAEYK